jgi:predicted N-acetyltransferase YhbS
MKPINHPDLSEFFISHADPRIHLMPISQFTANAFANGQHVEEISKTYIGNCHYDFDATRLIWDGDKLIHHWGVWGYSMRLGAIQLRVAGIGAVATLEEYRRLGLMFQAATDSFGAMHDLGYDLAILRGQHYHKFGFRRAWNYITTRLTPEEIPDVKIQLPYEELGPEHMEEINALYNEEYADFSGTAVRPTYSMLKSGDMNAKGWFGQDGKLRGYVRVVPTEDNQTLQCLEATGDPQQALAVLGELFKQGEYQDLTFFTFPHLHPLVQIIRRGSCLVENRYFYHTGWQVKVINLVTALAKMVPLLEKRIQQSQFASWKGTLYLEGDQQVASLLIDHGQIQVRYQPPGEHKLLAGPALGRLIIGSDYPREILQEEGIKCSGLAVKLTDVLFPNMHPMMSHFDEY